jgi:hypothetical protein
MSAVVAASPVGGNPRRIGRFHFGRPTGLLILGLVLVALAPPAYLLQTGGALTTGYNIQHLQQERAAWIVRNEQLEAEIAKAHSLPWVEHEAVYRLGMQRPAQQTVIRMDVPPPSTSTAKIPSRESSMPISMPSPPPPADDQSVLNDLASAVGGLVSGQ